MTRSKPRLARHRFVPALAVILSLPAAAATDGAPSAGAGSGPGWTGSIGLGLFSATGNTESSSTNLDVQAELAHERWRHAFVANVYRASEEGEDTAERYRVRLQSNYSLTERTYAFGAARHEVDRFGAFDRETSLTAGIGRRFLDTDTLRLDLETGVGRRVTEPDGTNERNSETVASLRGDFAWRLSATSELTQELEVLSGSENTASRSVTGIKSDLTGALALKVTYTVEHDSDVPPGTEKTDTFTAVTLEYGF